MKCSKFLLFAISKLKKRFKYLEFLISAEFGSLLQEKVSKLIDKVITGCLAKTIVLNNFCKRNFSLCCYEYNYG